MELYLLVQMIFLSALISFVSSKDCRFGNGKPASPGCSGCDKLDPKVISVCSSSGRWEKKRCSDGLKCVFPSGTCSARCDDESGTGGSVVDSSATTGTCHFTDGKPADSGCAGCVRNDPTLISICKSNGQWEKQKCAEGSLCNFQGASCKAICKPKTEGSSSTFNNTVVSTSGNTKTCSFINNKSANPGCAGCVKNNPDQISTCQPNGKWEKIRCVDGTVCTFKSGSCSAVCLPKSEANIANTTVIPSSTGKTAVFSTTTPSNSAKLTTTEELIEVVDSP